jgi:hypothetical protein
VPPKRCVLNIDGKKDVSFEVSTAVTMKNAVRTSQETHYVSTTESSQLMLCKF